MPYTLRHTWPDDDRSNQDDFEVMLAGKAVGRIYKSIGVGGKEVWTWAIYGRNPRGREATLEAAKAQWKTAFEGG